MNVLGTLWRRFLELLGDHVEMSSGDSLCPMCRECYSGIHRCALQTVGFCSDCARNRLLNHYGNCERCGSRSISSRTFLSGHIALMRYDKTGSAVVLPGRRIKGAR